MNATLATGGLPALVRLLLHTTDSAIQSFNRITANTSESFSFNVNLTRSAQGLLRILDAVDSNANSECVL